MYNDNINSEKNDSIEFTLEQLELLQQQELERSKKAQERLEQIKRQRQKQKSIGEPIENIPFAWRYPVFLTKKRPNKILKNMFSK